MGSGSEDEDEDGSSHHHHGGVGGSHLGPHNLGPGGPGDQTVGHTGDLPLGSDPCKQEDSEDQGTPVSHCFTFPPSLFFTLVLRFEQLIALVKRGNDRNARNVEHRRIIVGNGATNSILKGRLTGTD